MHPRLSEHRTLNEGHAKQLAAINDFTSNQRVGQPLKLHMGSLKNPPALWFQETRRIIEATAPAPRLAMAASVVRDSFTWPQSSITHETAQFGRFTDLDVMPRIAKNEATPNALRTRQPQPKPPSNEIFWSLSGTSPFTTSILASLLPLPIASNALFGNFYTRFLLFLSIFRDF